MPLGKKPYIVGPVLDWPLLILNPLAALALGAALSRTPIGTRRLTLWGSSGTAADGFIGAFIMAHLVLVFFRSHGNPAIRRLYPWRFFAVPILLWLALLGSVWARVTAAVLAVFWDVYHSSLQTFGIARIYDRNWGNDPEQGRGLDILLNHFLYIGPLLAGAMLMHHAGAFYEYQEVGSIFFTAIPDRVAAHRRALRAAVLGCAAAFAVLYLVGYRRLARRGYRAPPQKTALLLSTALTSIWTWGFNSFGMALFIMNFFHAFQYFVLVWAYERGTVTRLFRLDGLRRGPAYALALFILLPFAYGAAGGVLADKSDAVLSATLVVSLLHFWYDGFIWSVRAADGTRC